MIKEFVKYLRSIEQIIILRYVLKWVLIVLPVAIFSGTTIALFLYLLDLATHYRWEHQWLLFLLPLAGVFIVWVYDFKGKNTSAGNNLLFDEIHKPGGGVPFRMTPFVLVTTVITHLFGGSAGREGTAVQIGGSLASLFSRILKLNADDTRILLMTGIAGGFGAVFGTPVAGAIFALEVLAIGRIKYDALLPCLMSAMLADIVCRSYGINHTFYHISFQNQLNSATSNLNFEYLLLLKVIVASICFGIISYVFSLLSRQIKSLSNLYIKNKYLIPFVGGALIIALTMLAGTSDYLGLGVATQSGSGTSILNAFKGGEVEPFGWAWKLVFTSITLSMGFKGGEVTPLFFIGATLGNALAVWMGAPIDLLAGLGFIAVFAGATNTPLACTIMGIELFGANNVLYYAVACFIAYYFSGHSGIYKSQKIAVTKANIDNKK